MRSIDMSNLQVLVADPNPYALNIVKGMLRGFGVTKICEASDSATALKQIGTLIIDVIIVDSDLEIVNGTKLTKMLRAAKNNHNRAVPVIMLSARTEKWRINTARDAGVTEFLRKPLSANHLHTRLMEVLQRPRGFVNATHYSGPDRRRRKNADFPGDERRDTDSHDIEALKAAKRR